LILYDADPVVNSQSYPSVNPGGFLFGYFVNRAVSYVTVDEVATRKGPEDLEAGLLLELKVPLDSISGFLLALKIGVGFEGIAVLVDLKEEPVLHFYSSHG